VIDELVNSRNWPVVVDDGDGGVDGSGCVKYN